MKPTKSLERIVKGFANRRRIAILMLLSSRPDLSLMGIADACGFDFQITAQHVSKLFIAGFVEKRDDGRMVLHKLTPLGHTVLSFLKHL